MTREHVVVELFGCFECLEVLRGGVYSRYGWKQGCLMIPRLKFHAQLLS